MKEKPSLLIIAVMIPLLLSTVGFGQPSLERLKRLNPKDNINVIEKGDTLNVAENVGMVVKKGDEGLRMLAAYEQAQNLTSRLVFKNINLKQSVNPIPAPVDSFLVTTARTWLADKANADKILADQMSKRAEAEGRVRTNRIIAFILALLLVIAILSRNKMRGEVGRLTEQLMEARKDQGRLMELEEANRRLAESARNSRQKSFEQAERASAAEAINTLYKSRTKHLEAGEMMYRITAETVANQRDQLEGQLAAIRIVLGCPEVKEHMDVETLTAIVTSLAKKSKNEAVDETVRFLMEILDVTNPAKQRATAEVNEDE